MAVAIAGTILGHAGVGRRPPLYSELRRAGAGRAVGGPPGKLLGTAQINKILASPAVADGAIYFRSNTQLWKVARRVKDQPGRYGRTSEQLAPIAARTRRLACCCRMAQIFLSRAPKSLGASDQPEGKPSWNFIPSWVVYGRVGRYGKRKKSGK